MILLPPGISVKNVLNGEKYQGNFKLGNEVLLTDKFALIKNKNIALVTNNSGVISDGTFFVDELHKNESIYLKKIFCPEHGFRGDDNNQDHTDINSNIPVISLYGNKNKPSSNDLEDVEIIVYDIQDVAVRFYTYINTMYYCMEAALENNKRIIICDRPIISCPDYVDGFLLDENFKSFVGMLNIPVSYGMTCGELAKYINSEYFNEGCDLVIAEMKNYSRDIDYSDLFLTWKKPSPNMYYPSTAVIYPGTCLLEGTNISEGRGTDYPFEYLGAPYCNSDLLKKELDSYNFIGVEFQQISFIPVINQNTNVTPKYNGENCNGVQIKILNKKIAEPFKIGIAVLISFKHLFSEFKWRKDNYIDKLSGTDELRKMIDKGKSYNDIISLYKSQIEEFNSKRKKFLLYK